MGETNKPGKPQYKIEPPSQTGQRESIGKSNNIEESRDEKLARQLRENLAKRKRQSRARNTKPRKFKNEST